MSILIKGMKMPTSCAKCKLFGEYGCPFIGAVGRALTEGRRNEDCPLVPIPPHGDLIDRNKLFNGEHNLYCWEEIEEQPTVIPAEEED